jgi:membrane-associated phospholipid phosphatase
MRMQLQAPAFRGRSKVALPQPHPATGPKAAAVRLIGGAVVLWGLMCLLGLLMAQVLNTGPVHTADLGVDRWFAARRTGPWNDVTKFVTDLAQTWIVIGVTAAMVLLLRWWLGRWYEGLMLIIVMVGELVIFVSVTEIIERHRPPVPHLDPAPPTSSFPSGHTGASVALYGGLAILLLWVLGRRPVTRATAVVLLLVPVLVGISRLYRGMHYPSDVLAGALLGGTWLLLVTATLLPRRGAADAGARGGAARRGAASRRWQRQRR